MFSPPISGSISARLTALTNASITDLTRRDKYTIQELIDVLDIDPVAKACAELKALRATLMLGDYEHENEQIKKWVRDNFETMTDSLPTIVGQLASALPLGFSAAEIIYSNQISGKRGEWRLKGINVLDPRKVTFRGLQGNFLDLRYNNGNKEVYLPYYKCLHLTSGLTTSFGDNLAYGQSEVKRAYPYIKLKQTVFCEMAVSAKTRATGILVGLSDSNNTVQMYDANNRPLLDGHGNPVTINAVANLSRQLQDLENNSIVCTDKSNQITALQIPAGEQLYSIALGLINTQIMRAMSCPEMIWNEGSINTATLSQNQLGVLDSSIESFVKQMRDCLIERVVRPLIVYNFGIQKGGYGSFAVSGSNDPTQNSLRIQNLLTAMSSSIIPSNDVDGVNVLRELLGLPVKSPEELAYDQQMQALLAQQAPPETTAANEQYP